MACCHRFAQGTHSPKSSASELPPPPPPSCRFVQMHHQAEESLLCHLFRTQQAEESLLCSLKQAEETRLLCGAAIWEAAFQEVKPLPLC